MKAIQVTQRGGPEVLELADLPEPVPAEGQVLVKVEVAGVNFSDILARRGTYPRAPAPPFVPGIEVAGIVAQVDSKTSDFKPGDRVVGFAAGGYAEYALLPSRATYPVPTSVSLEAAAATFVVFNTAWHCLKIRAHLQPGETVLIQAAAGAVGTAAIQLAKMWGARVLACASLDEKLARVKGLGADTTINYATTDFVEAARRETAGRGVDVALESVGGEMFDRSFQVLAHGGRLVVIGSASGELGTVQVPLLLLNNLATAGFSIHGTAARAPEALRASTSEILSLLAQGTIRPVVGRAYALAEAGAAQRHIESRESFGKAILTVT